jgi:UDP-N-acetylglucosamine transferase subunit ALG13
MDELAGVGMLKGESVIIQSGSASDFRARHCKQRDFFPPDEYRDLIRKADVVVCHGGAGTLHHVFESGKVPVVMPRRKKYREHVDDQFELVKAIAEEGRIIAAYEPDDLPNAIVEAKNLKRARGAPPETAIALIGEAIEQLCLSRT